MNSWVFEDGGHNPYEFAGFLKVMVRILVNSHRGFIFNSVRNPYKFIGCLKMAVRILMNSQGF